MAYARTNQRAPADRATRDCAAGPRRARQATNAHDSETLLNTGLPSAADRIAYFLRWWSGLQRWSAQARLVPVFCLVCMLVACTPASTAAAPALPVANVGADTGLACADAFDTFVEQFGREPDFQKTTTADPLTVERYDITAEPEPRRVAEQVALDEVAWPVMPRLDMLAAQGRTHDIRVAADGRTEVQIRSPDTSDQQTYVFERTPCWQLQRIFDASI